MDETDKLLVFLFMSFGFVVGIFACLFLPTTVVTILGSVLLISSGLALGKLFSN